MWAIIINKIIEHARIQVEAKDYFGEIRRKKYLLQEGDTERKRSNQVGGSRKW